MNKLVTEIDFQCVAIGTVVATKTPAMPLVAIKIGDDEWRMTDYGPGSYTNLQMAHAARKLNWYRMEYTA